MSRKTGTRVKAMNENLMREAEAVGINASLYYFLPPNKCECLLQKDIDRAKRQAEKQSANDDE